MKPALRQVSRFWILVSESSNRLLVFSETDVKSDIPISNRSRPQLSYILYPCKPSCNIVDLAEKLCINNAFCKLCNITTVNNSLLLCPVNNAVLLQPVTSGIILQRVNNAVLLQPVNSGIILQPVNNAVLLQPVISSILQQPVNNAVLLYPRLSKSHVL